MHRQYFTYGSVRQLFPGNNHIERLPTPPQQQILRTKTNTTTKRTTKPSQNDVVCVRGRSYWDHPGNQIYRKCIALAKNRYSKAHNRLGKSVIVSEIVDAIHNAHGRFVKKVCGKTGEQWVECNDNFIREKVTQSLRDGLSFKYSSSTTRKRQRKAKVQELFHGDIDRIVYSNIAVSHKIQTLKRRVERTNRYHATKNESVSDETMMCIFDPANLDILETIKKDRSMLDQLHHITSNSTATHHRENPGISLSSTTTASTAASALTSSFSSSFSSSYTNNTSMAAAAATIQYEHKYDSMCGCDDDVVLDLDSTFMFLDEIGR